MTCHAGRTLRRAPVGTATEVIVDELNRPDEAATVAAWLLDCPGQSPAWRHYLLSVIHLRPIPDVPPAVINVPGATHEVILVALDPELNPDPNNDQTWRPLLPINVQEQLELPDDDDARELLELCVKAVLAGILPAEPPLAGQREPWRATLIVTAAHLRGEPHARPDGGIR